MAVKLLLFQIILAVMVIKPGVSREHLFLETESFQQKGGWVVDQQSFDVIYSSYLMAHGLGKPVEDASTNVNFPGRGKYHVWVRTKDWAPFPTGPGAFQVLIGGKPLSKIFGADGSDEWKWYYGGVVDVPKREAIEIRLKDLSGFNGRCDAIYFTTDKKFTPPDAPEALLEFRRKMLQLNDEPLDKGFFDFVVVGGGVAGTCAAIVAARKGLKVALIQNRPVLGGNNSSEVRVGLSGLIHQQPYPMLGNIVDEIGSVGHWTLWEARQNPDAPRSRRILEEIEINPEKKIHNAGPATNYGDDKKLSIVLAEPNISVFLNTHISQALVVGARIESVLGRDIETGQEYLFRGTWFADCTGDGTLGYLAGADYRIGRESRSETGESLAQETADDFTMGTSNLWYTEDISAPSTFPETPWAIQFSDEYHIDADRADWEWETGFGNFNTITEAEKIRDHNLRAIFGNWSYLKNNKPEKYANHELKWVAYIGGKRESRRLLGDHILNQMDLQSGIPHPDGTVTGTWTIDLHYPNKNNSKYFLGQEFLASTTHTRVQPYTIPYRCLYSRNINNLFMAGRNISTTHVAFGSTRVMRTCGMMGEVVGYAAAVCHQQQCDPADVYSNYLDQLLSQIKGSEEN